MRQVAILSVLLTVALPAARAQFELHKAVETGDVAAVKKLIADKVDVNQRRPAVKEKDDPKKDPMRFKSEGQWMVWYAQKKKEAHMELPLHGAIYLDHTDMIALLLAAGAKPNLKLTAGGKTALHVAAESRRALVVPSLTQLIKADGDLDVADDQGYTVLHRLIEQHHDEGFELVLKHKVNVNAPSYLKRTPLHWAAQTNQPKLARRLIKAGADVNLGDGWATPLEAALWRGNIELAADLVRAGAKTDLRDKSGQTLLHHIMTWPDTWTARFALRHKVPINAQDNDGNTALHLAFKNVWREDVFVTLVNAADLTLKNKKGETAFDAALKHYSYPAARILALKMKPAPKVDGLEILHKTQWQREEIVAMKKKLDKGAKVNEMTQKPFIHSPHYQDREWPMLAYAASIKNDALLDFLLAHGATADARTQGSPSALEVAAAQGSWIMVHALLEAKANAKQSPLALHDACAKGYVEIARLLLKAGANPNARYPKLPLEIAVERGDLDLLDALLEFKADVNGTSNKSHKPMLTYAWGKRLLVERLLGEKDIDINAANSSGTTALHLAASDGEVAMVRRLLERGAKVNALSNGRTPLDLAVQRKHADVITLLKNRGGKAGEK